MGEDNKKLTVSIDSTVCEVYKIFTEPFRRGRIELKIGDCANCVFYITGVVTADRQYSVGILEKNSKGERQITGLGAKFYPSATSLEKVLGDYCNCH